MTDSTDFAAEQTHQPIEASLQQEGMWKIPPGVNLNVMNELN